MELTFVNQYGNDTPKRRRLAKACESCRARKKRCIHYAKDPSKDDAQDSIEDSAEDKDRPIPQTKHFISDLNPEATFLHRSTPVAHREDRQPNDDIGVWVDRREWDALVRQKKDAQLAANESAENARPHPLVLPPLIDIYFSKVHPILPLLDEPEFRRNYAAGVVPEILTHAICLVAAKDASARLHLRLNESADTLPPREFCRRLHASITSALPAACRLEKITHIRILTLVSMHSEGQDGAEEATMCLNKAMHYTQTLGWHLGQQTGVASGDDLTTKRLFWCLWSLDRIYSCVYGRPVMMSDIDIAIEPFETGESKFPAFEVWLAICHMLNKTISFYRPGNDLNVTGWEENFPNFEEAVDRGKAWGEPQSVLATLHLFYLLVAVLSHRSRGVKFMPRSTSSYIRQSLCSIELHRMMNSHIFDTLHPVPILPYSISLALSVSYQHLRQSQLQHQQEDAREDFRACCQVLQKLRRTWSSADVIATISRKVLDELNKAEDLSSFRVGRFELAGRHSPGICAASLTKPYTLIDRTDHGDEQPSNPNGTAAVPHPDPNTPGNQDWTGLFEGLDDVLGTYLDPNYPVNLDDFSFLEDPSPVDWNAVQS